MDQVWDPRGEAYTALAAVVEGFGVQVLGRADMLEGLLQDDIPQLPREAALLTAAARSGVADLLAGRVEQGISPPAAVSMAAAEMTARTAVDASGAPWAAGAFARVLGYAVPAPTIPLNVPAPTTPTPTMQAQEIPPPTVVSPGRRAGQAGPVPPHAPGSDQETVLPAGDQRPTMPVSAATGRRLSTAAVATAAIAAPMQLLWCAVASADGVLTADFFPGVMNLWLSAVFFMIGFAGVAVWAARGWRGGAGFAAVLGIAVPATATAVTSTALAPALTNLPGSLRTLLELISVFWLATLLTAVGLSLAGLVRWHQLARHRPGVLPGLLAVAGVGYALANILAQGEDGGRLLYNALGPGVSGWWIVWGLAFVVLTAVPPALTAFLLAGSGVRLAAWSGWLTFALINQISESPDSGITAKPGLYLTWVLWIAVLAGTVVMAVQRRASPAGARPV